jgi:hypothetical protein
MFSVDLRKERSRWSRNYDEEDGLFAGNGRPLSVSGLGQMWLRLTRRIGIIPKKRGSVGTRYGYNAHEMRDIAKSFLHTHAKKDGFDMDCCEFWLGHTVDELGYDKFFQDQEYVKKQYLIAEKYLNILTGSAVNQERELKRQEEIEKMQKELLEIKKSSLEMREILNKLQPAKPEPHSIR